MERNSASMADISQEEVSKLTKAMKDKQFQGHMDEYCREISDPAHRKEYLQYLDQLEAKGEIPDGQCLLRTEPGCCVKTTIMFKNGQTQKCFLNIVYSDRIADMSQEDDGKGGKRVKLPYSLSPPRPERDNKDENCMTCDFAVGTWTFGQAIQRPQVLKMLVDTASDGLGAQFLKGHEEVKKDFKVMRRIRCRGPGGRPLPMSVKAECLKDNGKSNRPVHTSFESKNSITPSELKELRKEAKEKQLKPAKTEDDDEVETVKTKQEPPDFTTPSGAPRIRVPKHKLIHSGAYDLTDFMEASNRPTMLAQSVPRLLKLIIELPTVKKSSDVSLDVTAFNVCVEVQDKYYLDLPLSYEIDDAKGEAKFDKVAQTLTLELPVVPKPPDPNLLANRGQMPADGDTLDDEDGALSEGGESQDELPPLEDTPDEPPKEETPAPASPAASSASLPAEPKREVFEPKPRNEDLVPEEELPPFIECKSFEGARPGYYFGTSDDGLGYYRDSRQRRPLKEGVPAPKREPEIYREVADVEDASAPLIEEVDDEVYISASSTTRSSPKAAPLSRRAQMYVDATAMLTSGIAAAEIEEGYVDAGLSLDVQQTRQNLVFLIGLLSGHEVAGVHVSVVGRRLTVTFCTRKPGAEKWCRHHFRRTLCRTVDVRQWHVEHPKLSAASGSAEVPLVIVLRKTEQEPWPEIFDTSAAAVVAEREPVVFSPDIVVTADTRIVQDTSIDHTAPADTAAGTDLDAVDDSAELDIAAPAGAPAALGPAKDVSTSTSMSVPGNPTAAAAAAQSAAVMGQAVLLRTRLMYQLF